MKLARAIIKTSSGFTLIELILTIVIAGILAGAGIAYFNASGADQKLLSAAKELQTDLRYAQNLATSGTTCIYGGQASYSAAVVSQTITISKHCTPSEVAKTYDLTDSGVSISVTPSLTEVRFSAITGNVSFYDSGTSVSTTSATFQLTKGSSKNVTITSSGSIEIN
ncbi:MAG: prepilin-type N-terminal cleavage/methylation domain-containing protein [Patescibacteria group bacterium]|nr:prepilin-type N-terminal cleavage/methylation domain-containing protein [Patescibacteria group bacterium]